jgi:N-acetylglutamate synthase-like GNAT family acetyltransferase
MNKKALFAKYLKKLSSLALQEDAREESFYPALAEMLVDVAKSCGLKHVNVTTLPKATEAGNPDFRI